MCSPKELGLSEDAEGLLILRGDAPVGQPFAEYLGRTGGDVVLDLEVTPNRPDLNSVIGVAREIAALTGNPLRIPEVRNLKSEGRVQDLLAVRIEDPDLCPRYVARVVRGVKIGPSPDWLRTTLEKVGVRSINNVVDVTNYVMLETGQPLHAFDYHLISRSRSGDAAADSAEVPPLHSGASTGKPAIVIRRAAAGEKFTTLDGQERALTNEMLLIADEQEGIALAGVMGGANSEINERTVDVLIESACFQPANIRRTSKALGLRTDASYRFERGADIGITDWASGRCAQVILEAAGGELAGGVVDAFPQPRPPREITLRHSRTNALLGVEIPADEQIGLLQRLGLMPLQPAGEASTALTVHDADVDTSTLLKKNLGGAASQGATIFRIPTFRVDLKREADLIEEVCRLYGVEKIPVTPPRGAIGANAFDAIYDQIGEVRRILTGLGLSEAQGQTLISSTAAELTLQRAAGLSAAQGAGTSEAPVLLSNPLSSDMNAFRPSLLPGLLDSLRHNVSRMCDDVALFEIGRVFKQVQDQTQEERRVAMALTGQRAPPFWSGNNPRLKFDFYDLKGILEEFLDQFGLRGISYAKRDDNTPLFLESATIALGGKLALGELGQLSPTLAKKYDLRNAVFLAELNLDQLLARRNPTKSFKALPHYPPIRRDVAMVVPEHVTHDAVLSVVRQAKPANLDAVELFDVFRGQPIPEGRKSVAYAFTYRHAERTLTDEEVNSAHEKLVEHFKQKLEASIR